MLVEVTTVSGNQSADLVAPREHLCFQAYEQRLYRIPRWKHRHVEEHPTTRPSQTDI
jgi:hypothetical protein